MKPPEKNGGGLPKGLRQLLWFVGLWVGGLAVVSLVAFVIRSVLL